MIVVDGDEWVTAEEAIEQLGPDIRPDRLRDWLRRGLVEAHRVGQHNHYRLADLFEVEARTRRTGTRPRGTGSSRSASETSR